MNDLIRDPLPTDEITTVSVPLRGKDSHELNIKI